MKLHKALLYAATGLMAHNTEELARWGLSIAGRHKQGGFRKARGAVARRISAALWYVHRKCVPWDASKYKWRPDTRVENAPLSSFLSNAAVKVLATHGITTAQELCNSYLEGTLGTIKGFGSQSLMAARRWLDTHRLASRNATSTGKDYPLHPSAVAPKPAEVENSKSPNENENRQ